jgi:hypothetical protein
MKGNNDNLDPWTSIGLQTNLILNRLRNEQAIRDLVSSEEKKEEPSGEDSKPSNQDERRDTEHEEYVATRCREIRAWEKRARGLKK